MTFSSQHILYTLSGGLPGGEIWSCGLRTVAATVTSDQLVALAQGVGIAFRDCFNVAGGIKAHNPAGVTFLACTARQIGLDGKTTEVYVWVNPQTTAGNAAAQTAPDQSALVTTLYTAKAGRSGKGRVYLPWLSPSFNAADGHLVQADCAITAGAMATFLSTVATPPAGPPPIVGPFRIAVQSQVAGAGAPPVTSVGVGNVLDTQRRRRDSLKETYSLGAVTTS